jgi:type IV pilus assembly protein PilV
MQAITRLKSPQRGVTLLESLLGILIFSIGILAVIGMQANAVRAVAEAKYRTDASFLANALIGQMWVDRGNLASYAYAGSGTPAAVLQPWVDRVAATLPGTDTFGPTITVDVDNTVTVTIFWQHPEEANLSPAPPPHSYSSVALVSCC